MVQTDTFLIRFCVRCGRREAEPDKSRCSGCLEYAKNWQKSRTADRRKKHLCISCGTPTGGSSRCVDCAAEKSAAYVEKKSTVSINNLIPT